MTNKNILIIILVVAMILILIGILGIMVFGPRIYNNYLKTDDEIQFMSMRDGIYEVKKDEETSIFTAGVSRCNVDEENRRIKGK